MLYLVDGCGNHTSGGIPEFLETVAKFRIGTMLPSGKGKAGA